MRVVLVGDYPLNSSEIWGGEQAAFSYLVKALCQIDDLDVHILKLANSAAAERRQKKQDGATLHLLPPLPRFELARRFKTYQSYANAALAEIQPDLVHAQGAIHHAYVALGSGYPTVITVHGVQREDSKYQSSFYLRTRKWLVSLLIERYCLRHTRHLIAISHYVTTYFASQLKPDVQVYYVPNAIDGSFFNLDDASNGRTILFAGRIIQRKRVLDLVRAFARVIEQLPSAQLRLAGEYSSETAYSDSIRDLIRSANLEECVHLLGPLPEDAVLREFASCDALALPSAQETTPMVIAQAMAAGKPVVATPVGGVPEMVKDTETGFLIEVGDADGLVDAMLRLLNDPPLRAQLGKAGRQFAVENYRADNVAKRTYDVYRKITTAGRD